MKVSLETGPAEVVVKVSDNGAGIAEDHLALVGEPLIQVDRHLSEQQGLGLGLAVARGMTELHGGRLWITSREGLGTEVHIALPRTDVAGATRPVGRARG